MSRGARSLVFGALLLAATVQLSPVLFLGRPVGVCDILGLHVPWRVEPERSPANPLLGDAATSLQPWVTSLLRDRELLASPSQGAGSTGPLAAVFGVLSPSVLLPFGLLPRSLALTGAALLDLAISFLLFFLWRRSRGDAALAAALGAAVWAWAPARTVWRAWPQVSLTWFWPLLLILVDLPFRPRSPRADRLALAWALCGLVLVLGGHPSFAAMGLYLALGWTVARLAQRNAIPGGRGSAFGERLALCVRAPLTGLSLAALILAPCLILGASFLLDGEWRQVRAPIAGSPPVSPRVLLLLFDPGWFGSPTTGTWRSLGWSGPDNLVELQLYMGLVPLLLAPLALASRRREALFFTSIGSAALLAFVVGGPFAVAARALPGIGIAFLPRLKLVLLFSVAALVSLGAGVVCRLRLPRIALPGLLLFTALDLSLATQRFDPFPQHPDAAPLETPALTRLRELAPGGGHRFLGFGTALPPNVAFELGLEDVRAHLLFSGGYRRFVSRLDPLAFGRHGTFLTFEPGTFRPDPWVLDLLGVSALIAAPSAPAPGGDFSLAYRGRDADVWRRPWSPPARVVSRAGGEASTGHVEAFDAHRTSWRLVVNAGDDARVLLGRSRLRVVDRILLDGAPIRPVPDARAEGLLALDVPEGRHELRATAALPAWLAWTSALGLLGLASLSAFALRAEASPGSPPGRPERR